MVTGVGSSAGDGSGIHGSGVGGGRGGIYDEKYGKVKQEKGICQRDDSGLFETKGKAKNKMFERF